jgi:uncharacterized protein
MVRVGLISDTHGFLDKEVFRHFEECDEVWHAGDFGSLDLLRQLREFKPFRGVWGNIDGGEIRQEVPEINDFTIEGVKVLMMHIGGYPGRYTTLAKQVLAMHRPQLFITGHSHILKVMFDDKIQCLHINPGAAGQQGWHKVRTLVRLTIDDGKMRDCEVIELGTRG